ncbi:MAG: glycosyl hydrolase family 18 protein [Sedimentisphaerales bacterium]|nr:glycosyl hydrolase family 18 protein [Sedimentisphaerales bacterium]
MITDEIRAILCVASVLIAASRPCTAGGFVFRELWGYLYKGEEAAITGQEPITDLCYFSATVDETGRVRQAVQRPGLGPMRAGRQRVHLVINAPSNRSLMYFCLAKDRQTRDALLEDIVSVSSPFDGVQIDFETVRPEDKQAFISFLTLLKIRLGADKTLSVAVPARTGPRADAYDYNEIGRIADKVLVMAYDEHWQGGEPGPICSLDWCRRVCDYATKQIPTERLIIGLPLYGRAWQVVQYSRALRFHQTIELLDRLGKSASRDNDKTPYFEYLEPVRVKVYFEDTQSLSAKLQACSEIGVRAVGFWRLGQGPVDLWQVISSGQ